MKRIARKIKSQGSSYSRYTNTSFASHKQARKSYHSRVAVGVLVFLILSLAVGHFHKGQVKTVRIDSASTLSDELEEATYSHIDTTGILGSHSLFFDTDSLEAKLKTELPQLSQIEATLEGTEIVLTASTAEKRFIWASGASRYFLDSKGVVISSMTLDDDQSSYLSIVDGAALPVKVGDIVASSEFIAFVSAAVEGLEQHFSRTVGEVRIPGALREVHVYISDGPYVRFDTSRSVEAQLADIEDVLEFVDANDLQIDSHIDVRIPQKAYYR